MSNWVFNDEQLDQALKQYLDAEKNAGLTEPVVKNIKHKIKDFLFSAQVQRAGMIKRNNDGETS